MQDKPAWVIWTARIVGLLLLLPAGVVCVATPFLQLALKDDHGLFDDSRALLGGGKAEAEVRVSSVDCVKERTGSTSSRGIGLTTWDCAIDFAAIAPAKPAPTADRPAPAAQDAPYKAGSYAEQMAEYERRIAEFSRRTANYDRDLALQFDAARTPGTRLSRIERTLPTNRTGDLPGLRRLAEGDGDKPPRFGLVWGVGDMVWRWLFWLLTSALLWAFGAASLFAARIAWRGKKT